MDDQLKLNGAAPSQTTASMWENEARKAWAYLDEIAALRVALLQVKLAFAEA